MFPRTCLFLVVLSVLAAACSSDKDEGGMAGAMDQLAGGKSQNEDTSGGSPSGTAGRSAGDLQATAADLPAGDRTYVVDAKSAKVRFEGATLTDRAVVAPGSALIESGGSDGTQAFDTAKLGALASDLERGNVLLVPGSVLGEITSVSTSGGKTLVKTKFAPITAAIKDADFGWEASLPVHKGHVTAFLLPDGRTVERGEKEFYAALERSGIAMNLPTGPMEWEIKGEGLKYQAKLDKGDNHVEFEVLLSREAKNIGGLAYRGKVRFEPAEITGDGSIEDGDAKSFAVKHKNVGGEVTLSISAAGKGRHEINKDLDLPVFKWIVLVGPLPLVIKARPRIIGRVDLPAKGSSVAEATFGFGGEAGIRLTGATVDARAAFPKDQFKVSKTFDAAAFIGGAVDAQFGVAFPVLSMGFFDSFFVPELIPGAQMGARLTWGPVCKTGYLLYTLKLAYDFKIFDKATLAKKKYPIYEKRKDSKDGGCREEKK